MDRKEKLTQAAQLGKAGQIEASLQLLYELVDTNPQDKTAWWGIAATSKEPLEKRRAVNEVLALAPHDAKALNLKQKLDAAGIPAEPPMPAEAVPEPDPEPDLLNDLPEPEYELDLLPVDEDDEDDLSPDLDAFTPVEPTGNLTPPDVPRGASTNELPALHGFEAPQLAGIQDISDELHDLLPPDMSLTSDDDWGGDMADDMGEEMSMLDFTDAPSSDLPEPALELDTDTRDIEDFLALDDGEGEDVPGWLADTSAEQRAADEPLPQTGQLGWQKLESGEFDTVPPEPQPGEGDVMSTRDFRDYLPMDDDTGIPTALPELTDDFEPENTSDWLDGVSTDEDDTMSAREDVGLDTESILESDDEEYAETLLLSDDEVDRDWLMAQVDAYEAENEATDTNDSIDINALNTTGLLDDDGGMGWLNDDVASVPDADGPDAKDISDADAASAGMDWLLEDVEPQADTLMSMDESADDAPQNLDWLTGETQLDDAPDTLPELMTDETPEESVSGMDWLGAETQLDDAPDTLPELMTDETPEESASGMDWLGGETQLDDAPDTLPELMTDESPEPLLMIEEDDSSAEPDLLAEIEMDDAPDMLPELMTDDAPEPLLLIEDDAEPVAGLEWVMDDPPLEPDTASMDDAIEQIDAAAMTLPDDLAATDSKEMELPTMQDPDTHTALAEMPSEEMQADWLSAPEADMGGLVLEEAATEDLDSVDPFGPVVGEEIAEAEMDWLAGGGGAAADLLNADEIVAEQLAELTGTDVDPDDLVDVEAAMLYDEPLPAIDTEIPLAEPLPDPLPLSDIPIAPQEEEAVVPTGEGVNGDDLLEATVAALSQDTEPQPERVTGTHPAVQDQIDEPHPEALEAMANDDHTTPDEIPSDEELLPVRMDPVPQQSVVRYETPAEPEKSWLEDPEKRAQVVATAAVGLVVARTIWRVIFRRNRG